MPHEKDGNFKFDANHFAEMGGYEPERLLRREQDMLRALKYHLMTFHAYRFRRALVHVLCMSTGSLLTLLNFNSSMQAIARACSGVTFPRGSG